MIVVIFTTLSFSQIDSTKIPFVAYWSIGDSYNFKVSKIKKQWKDGNLTKNEEQSYIANFTVIDSTENSYTVNWSYENDLVNTYNIPKELISKFSKYKLTEIKYKTSELGDLLEIINWQEVGEIMNNMFNDLIEVLGENDEEKTNALNLAMQPFKQAYSAKEGVESLVLKEIQYFHFPMGLKYDITEPITYEDELPNMFGGEPIKADAKLYFENVDFEEGFCVLKQEMHLNEDDTKKMLKQLFFQMQIDEKGMKNALKTATVKIDDKNTYEYYFNPGIPHKIEAKRESLIDINNEKGKRLDITIIELIYNE